MQEFDLSQQVCALCGDDSITQHIETGAIPTQGRGGQFQVVLHHGGAVRQEQPALTHHLVRLRPQGGVQLRTVHQQHQLRVQIGAAHIPVEGADDAESVVDQDRLGVHGSLPMPLADGNAGGQNGLFLVEVVGAAPRIGAALGCVGDDLHLCRTAGGLFQRVIHGAVADDVGGLHHNLLPTALHQRRQGVQQHRLLVPRRAVAVKNGHAASLYGLRIPVDGRHPPRAGDSSPPLPERGSGAQYPPRFAVYPELPVGIQRPDVLKVTQQRGDRPPPGAAAAHHHIAVHVLPRRAAAAEEQVAGVPSAHKVGAAVDDEILVVAAIVGAPEPGQP